MTSQMIESGAAASVGLRVGPADTARAMGSGDLDVLATPRVVALLEEAAVAAVSGLADAAQTTVGTLIELRHLAPSQVGSDVVGTATVTAVSGRRIEFDVEATMNDVVVAEGTHSRVIVQREAFGA
jgi:fluoroacetyl-CoA thioesterase